VLARFRHTATGWMLVGIGACLIAIEETAALSGHYGWPAAVQWPLVAVMICLSVAFTSASGHWRDLMLGRGHR
jgi:hypothetical protein